MNEIAYTTPEGETGYVYVPDKVKDDSNTKVPLVLVMCATTHEARQDAKATGWADKALAENLIVLAPNYDNYATYSQVDRIMSAVEYVIANYPVDTTCVYSTGFSNGGATSVAMCSEYPQVFAAISSLGWMVDLNCSRDSYAAFDMPFQVVQGTKEYTQQTASGAMAVMDDEQHAIRSLFLFNEMIGESDTAD
jgi:poly(3-hydroxybutyrate) depolymerase